MSNTATGFQIEVATPAGSTRTLILFYFNTNNNKQSTYEHHHVSDNTTHEQIDFDGLEKIIGETHKCSPVIYGFQFAISLVAEFIVNNEPVTLSKVITHEGPFYYVDGDILDRGALLKYCKDDMAKLTKLFPNNKEYIHVMGSILPFEKDKHQMVKRR